MKWNDTSIIHFELDPWDQMWSIEIKVAITRLKILPNSVQISNNNQLEIKYQVVYFQVKKQIVLHVSLSCNPGENIICHLHGIFHMFTQFWPSATEQIK